MACSALHLDPLILLQGPHAHRRARIAGCTWWRPLPLGEVCGRGSWRQPLKPSTAPTAGPNPAPSTPRDSFPRRTVPVPGGGSSPLARGCQPSERHPPLPPTGSARMSPREWGRMCSSVLSPNPEATLSTSHLRPLLEGSSSTASPTTSINATCFGSTPALVHRTLAHIGRPDCHPVRRGSLEMVSPHCS